jgi:hypothetical protein
VFGEVEYNIWNVGVEHLRPACRSVLASRFGARSSMPLALPSRCAY